MKFDRLRPDPVEFHPRPRPRDLLVHIVVRFVLGMNPYELRGTDPLGSRDLQLLHRGSTVAGMRRNRQSGLTRCNGRGSYQLAVYLVQRPAIDADLNESWPPGHTRLCYPPFRELRGRFASRKGRDKFMVQGAIQPGVRPDL